MKTKQLEHLQAQHSSYLGIVSRRPAPSMQEFVQKALVNHERLKVKSAKAIVQLCRNKVATQNYSSDRYIHLHELFESSQQHARALLEWKANERTKAKKQADHLKVALPLMDRARLDDDADPLAIAADLRNAAIAAGIISSAPIED